MSDALIPWGRWASLGLAFLALIASQITALIALGYFYGASLAHLPDFSGDGAAVSLVIIVSTPVEIALLILFARRCGDPFDYLGYSTPRRGDVIFGLAATVALIIFGNLISWLLGQNIVTRFQTDIYETANAVGWLPLLWLGVVVITPIGEETLFRGFLFRGLLHGPRGPWPAIVITAALWAIIHVQYDWYVIGQICAFGLLLGWLRWASGSTLLTMLLHMLINAEGMLETYVSLKWLS